ncbi:MAG: PEP-utilizing enzyme [Candidatus Nanoarchaeia archaeon]|nr:PEP-utilizing enzyme [Candidatus Nanoarchaeia archaeon]
MKLIKYLTRDYSLLEHNLVIKTLLKDNPENEGIYYNSVVDVFQKGFMDIYVHGEDVEHNKKFILDNVTRNKLFLISKVEEGIALAKELVNLPMNLPNKIKEMIDEEIINELDSLFEKLLGFATSIELVHCTERSGVKLNQKEIETIAQFNDLRKEAYLKYLQFFILVTNKIARKKGLLSKDLSYLTFDEIISFLEGKLSKKTVDELQNKRRIKYIMRVDNGKWKVITDNFDREYEKLKKFIYEDLLSSEVKGLPINKGVVRGKVKVVTQKTPFNEIPKGRIIVTYQTKPDMAPFLRKSIAIVTDEGGILCHAANLIREFKIVGIVGTKNATKVFKDGDLIEVNADNGTIRKIKQI